MSYSGFKFQVYQKFLWIDSKSIRYKSLGSLGYYLNLKEDWGNAKLYNCSKIVEVYQVDALHVHLVDDEDERLVPVRVQVARFDLYEKWQIFQFNSK